MPILKQAACIILLVATPLLATARQNPADKKTAAEQPKPTVEKKPALDPAQKKIFAQLDQLLETQKSFADVNLRIVIQAEIADLLWSYDEPRARRLFEDAFQMTAGAKLPEQSASASTASGGVQSRYSSRSGVINLILRHDPTLATKLVESIADSSPNSDPKLANNGVSRPSERLLLQQQLALQFTQQDPQRAVQAAQLFVEKGDFSRLMQLLGLLRVKDAKAANELFKQALAKAKLGQPSFEDIRGMAFYLFRSFGEGVIRFSANGGQGNAMQPMVSGSGVVEQFIDLACDVVTRRFDAAMANPDGARLEARSLLDYKLPKVLVPYVERYMPDRAAAFRARVEEALRRVPAEDQPYLILNEPGTIQELVARADAITDAQIKDSLYQRAVIQASLNGNFDQGLAISDKISSEDKRSNARETLRLRMDQRYTTDAWGALEKGDLDQTEALMAEIADYRQRLHLLGALLGRFFPKEPARALRLLAEAERRTASIVSGIDRAQQLMALASMVANLDANHGFEEMELAIKEFNRAGFAPEWEKYQETADSSGKPVTRVNIGLTPLLSARDFHGLGRKDFDRALLLTQQFQLREAAAIAQLSVCRGALENYPSSYPQRPAATAKPPATDKARQP